MVEPRRSQKSGGTGMVGSPVRGLSRVFGSLLWYNIAVFGIAPPHLRDTLSPSSINHAKEIHMTTYNTPAQVFDAAEEMSVALAEQLMMMGIGSKEEAKPHALQWASKKYGVPIRTGQRGDGFARDTKKSEAAHKAVQRVLNTIYPPSDIPSGKSVAKQTDEVARLIKKFESLTAAQKKRFLAGI